MNPFILRYAELLAKQQKKPVKLINDSNRLLRWAYRFCGGREQFEQSAQHYIANGMGVVG